MPAQILINIVVAFIWMFLNESYSFVDFFLGFLIGIFLLYMLRRFIPDAFYMERVVAAIKLVLLFIKELLYANWDIVKIVYRPKLDVEPGIFALPTTLKSNWEITLLANLITLTPGTLSVFVSNDNSKLYIHAMDLPDVEEGINSIKNTFEKAIREVTR
ncbi:Na+/H+ antiporter subunit E [Bacillus marinisedimentorum]|uniref:Na+/H+ antiporter subunit E n=1 Tax=Bacillus marinisedimentorum TaxID=1821260 RepID=UPI00087256D0|nr:Na+/H+ antiporter subunit E [Bacillus marinisedimentorum]